MSGRPAAPAYTVRTFAPDASYPAGPDTWNGNPTKVEPPGAASVGLTPGQGAAAQYMNRLFYDAYTQDASAKAEFATHLAWHGQAPALNFPVRVDSNQLATHIKFNSTLQRWFGCSQGGTDRFQTTQDPYTWGAASEIGGLNIITQTVWDFAFDASGNMIAASENFDYVWKRTAGGVWSTQSSVTGYDMDRPAIVYDAVHSLWCLAYKTDGGATSTLRVFTSPDGVTWTARTMPTGFPAAGAAADPLTMAYADGVIVMAVVTDTDIYTSRSTDGGLTWSANGGDTLGITAEYTGVAHDRRCPPLWTGSKWVVLVPDTGTDKTEVYTSADGASFSLAATLNNVAIVYCAAMGELLCGVSYAGEIVLSPDSGTSWQYGTRVLANVRGVAASPTQFMIAVNDLYLYPSLAMGLGNGPVT